MVEGTVSPADNSGKAHPAPETNDRWLLVILLGLVSITPLPLGSNRPLPFAILSLCFGLMLVLWSALWSLERSAIHPRLNDVRWAIFGYLAVCLWVLVQWSPWTPATLADPIWQSTAKLLGDGFGTHLTVNPDATLTGLMHLLVYASVFWLSFNLARNSSRAWTAINTLAGMGAVYAIYGIVVYLSGNDWILIYPKWVYEDSLTGTFVNRNSFATFAGLTLLCAVTVMYRHMTPFLALRHPLKAKIVLIAEEVLAKAFLKTLSVISITIALFLSTSRGGVASTVVGLLALGAIYGTQRRMKLRQILSLLGIAIVVAGLLFSISGNGLSRRLPDNQLDRSLNDRSQTYAKTWDAIMTSPWKGTGLGTFEDVFPAYRSRQDNPLIHWEKAHNTYLENALELGLPAALVLNLSIALVGFQCVRGVITRKRDKLIPALGVGATALVGVHSLVDFSLQIPAVAILYACIMGIATSQSWSQKNR